MTGSRPISSLRSFAALDWFTIFSAKINFLHDVATQLAFQLLDGNADIFTASSINYPLEAEVETIYNRIKLLPLVKNIGSGVLKSILHHARITVHDKGSIILHQGETAKRVYFVLEGWVKLYKNTAEGEEAILQIIGKNEMLLGTNHFENGPCPFSVRSITKIKLLSAPVNVVRDHILRHKDLMLHSLYLATRHTQKLMSHFEQLTLRSATQRVGWYLLNLALETGLDGRPINLPFDKSLVAAWLNIKPETFSRILQLLKSNGFRIDRQQILLPEPFGLCDFCDSETAAKCDLAGTSSCPKTEAQEDLPRPLRSVG